jgi:hypothetical protein
MSQNVCLFYLSVQNIFLPINIYQVSLELRTEMHVGLHIKHSLLLSHFNQNGSMVIHFWPSIILNFKEISKGFLRSLHTDHQRDKQCCAACILENRHMWCDCSLMTDLFLWQLEPNLTNLHLSQSPNLKLFTYTVIQNDSQPPNSFLVQ